MSIIEAIAKFKLCIFGDGGVGKTTLTHKFVNKIFNEDLKMTIGADLSVKEVEISGTSVVLRIWDFAGEERYQVLMPSFVKGADGGIFMYDTTRYASLKSLKKWISFFREEEQATNRKIPIIMVGGKMDLVDERSVDEENARDMSENASFEGYLECSAKTGENVEELFQFITLKMLENNGYMNE